MFIIDCFQQNFDLFLQAGKFFCQQTNDETILAEKTDLYGTPIGLIYYLLTS